MVGWTIPRLHLEHSEVMSRPIGIGMIQAGEFISYETRIDVNCIPS